jgi:hypothetical protein
MAGSGYFNDAAVGSVAYGVAVTKSDSTVLNGTRALYIGGTGDVAVRMEGGQNSLTFSAVPSGTTLPIRVDQVLSTGTTATLILALW